MIFQSLRYNDFFLLPFCPHQSDRDWETDKIINKPDERMSDIVMENIDNVVRAIKNDIYIKNFNACETKYGTLCDYYDLCHKGSEKGLVTK